MVGSTDGTDSDKGLTNGDYFNGKLIFCIFFNNYRFFCIFACGFGIPFLDIKEYKERYATLVSAKPEKLKHKINKNWHGSSHVIEWAALPYLLIKVFSGPAL